MFERFVARKVIREGTHSFARLIIRIAIIAVAISTAVMICAVALISGFKKEISGKIFGFWGHIHITSTELYQSPLEASPVSVEQPFYPYLDTLRSVDYPVTKSIFGMARPAMATTHGGIRHIQVFALKPGIIKANDEMEGIILKGIGKDFDWGFMQQYLVAGTALDLKQTESSSGILISRQTAQRLKVGVGDRFRLHFVEKGNQIQRSFRVQGIFKTGLEEYDRKFALVDIRKIQQLLGWDEKQVGGFEVFADDIRDLEPLAGYIYYELLPPDLYAETIRQKLPQIFDWLNLQDVNEVVILALMVIVAIINMVTALLILILERTYMIGTLKSLGASDWSIRKIFLGYAAYIVFTGLVWGNLLGIGLCIIQKYGEVIKLSEENYYLSVAPVHLSPLAVLALNFGAMLIILLFLVLPSYLVTRISPIKAIRFR
ncbi:MAG: ABC transporter permease [Saprospiraceae bacterium]|jgi:lipoprotein-releasing system permease protein